MSGGSETLAEIVAEMRGMGNYQRYSGDHAHALADRIEAAWKRESKAIATENAVLPAVCITKSAPVGNAAAMREALEKCIRIAAEWDTPGIHAVQATLYRIRDAANAALSAPPRACDVISKEDLTKVVTNALRQSLAKIPEFDWAKSLIEAVVASSIKCAYDTQLVVKNEGETDGSK